MLRKTLLSIGVTIFYMAVTGSMMFFVQQQVFASYTTITSPVVTNTTTVAWVVPGIYDAKRGLSLHERSMFVMQWLLQCIKNVSRPVFLQSAVPSVRHSAAPSGSDGRNAIRTSRRRGGGGGGNRTDGGSSSASNTSSEVILTTPTITFTDINKTYGDSAFTLSPTSDSNGVFTFTSSDTDVATVAGSTVTIVSSGSTTITVIQAEDGSYASGTATATLTINAATPSITFNDISKDFGDENFTPTPSSNSDGAFSYASNDTDIATISDGTTVVIVSAGSVTLTLTQAASGNYLSATGSATLTVNPITPTLSDFDDIAKQMGDIPFALTAPTSNSDGSFSYESDDTNIATVSGNTVTLVSSGSTSITATQSASGNYLSSSSSLTLTVARGACGASPCLNNGVCTNEPSGTYSCECTDGYSGDICEKSTINCDGSIGSFCLNGGTCVADNMGGTCECTACYVGTSCEFFNPITCE